MANYYEILNVTPTCTMDELRMNYKKLLLKYHPDKVETTLATSVATESIVSNSTTAVKTNIKEAEATFDGSNAPDNQYRDDNHKKFLSITEAWNYLKDPIKRKQYDAELMLQKFQMHSNIYAHITLNEMSIKQYSSNALSDESIEDVNINVLDDIKGKDYDDYYYYYTYNCRCGGQYILNYDDCHVSIEHQHKQQEIQHDNSYKYLINNQNQNSVTIMEENRKEQTNTFNCSNAEEVIPHKNNNNHSRNNNNNNENNEHNNDKDDSNDENVTEKYIDKQGVGAEEEQGNKETDTELIVECNECSLAIIVNV